MRRKTFALSVAVVFTAACTSILGDFSTGPAGAGPDASGDTVVVDGSHDEGGKIQIQAVATGSSVWLTQTASVDGSKSTASSGTLSYAWAFSAVASGSLLKSTDLATATSSTASFVPDVIGTYSLELTVSDGSQKATAIASVLVSGPKVFYSKATALTPEGIASAEGGGGGSSAFYVGGLDGKSRPVTCPNTILNNPDFGGLAGWPLFSATWLDFWEGEAGTPYEYAGFDLETYDAGGEAGLQTHLWSGSGNSSCDASPPVDLGKYPFGSLDNIAYGPRFSPDGTRIAFHDTNPNIVTFAAGGGAPTIVDSYFSGDPAGDVSEFDFNGGLNPIIVPSPAWFGTKVAWARPTGTTGWQIVMAPDEATGPISVYMNCSGITPREIYVLANGDVLTAHRATASGPVNLSLFQTNSAQNCSLVRRYSSLSDSSTAVATAFSVSPDETQIAFTSFDPATQDASFYGGGITVGYIYVAPVDGTSPPVRISNDPAIYGPRWIAGGRLLAFTKLDSFGDANAPPPTSIVVISPEGGTETVVDHADGVNATVALSSTLGCDISNQPVGAGAIALLSVIAMANLLLRRKRRA